MKFKLLTITLCLLSCLTVAMQVIYESSAVVQGFPASRMFLLIFWWQVASFFIILFATTIGLAKKLGYKVVTPVALFLSAAYPVIVAVTALWPTTWSVWLSTFKAFPHEGLLRLSVALLPAVFTVSLIAAFMAQREAKLA